MLFSEGLCSQGSSSPEDFFLRDPGVSWVGVAVVIMSMITTV